MLGLFQLFDHLKIPFGVAAFEVPFAHSRGVTFTATFVQRRGRDVDRKQMLIRIVSDFRTINATDVGIRPAQQRKVFSLNRLEGFWFGLTWDRELDFSHPLAWEISF